jgi:hypothetical protein
LIDAQSLLPLARGPLLELQAFVLRVLIDVTDVFAVAVHRVGVYVDRLLSFPLRDDLETRSCIEVGDALRSISGIDVKSCGRECGFRSRRVLSLYDVGDARAAADQRGGADQTRYASQWSRGRLDTCSDYEQEGAVSDPQ